jgi:hypothetical protein
VTDRLDETNQLPFVSQKFSMMRRYSPTEEGYSTIALVQYSAKASPRCVTIDDEAPGEVRKLQDWGCHERSLEGDEGGLCLSRPGEAITLEESRERGSHTAIAGDELVVVAREPQDAAKSPGRIRTGPGFHGCKPATLSESMAMPSAEMMRPR